MWRQYGSCADFPSAPAYFEFAVAAAKKYDADVSGAAVGLTATCPPASWSWLPPLKPPQEALKGLNCTGGFDAAELQQRLKDEWGVQPW